MYVAVLICNPAEPILTEAALSTASAHLPSPAAPSWLAPGSAAEIAFDAAPGLPLKPLAHEVRNALAGAPIDVGLLPAEHRRKRLLVADMDSTMIGQECIDELADMLGLKPEIAAITDRAMRGEIAFEPALRERVALLKGLDREAIASVLAKRITLTPGARALVQTMRANGAFTSLVSGGFTAFTTEVARLIGFDENRANTLVFDGEALAGSVSEPILGREAKLGALREHRDRLGLVDADTLAVGDGANDLAMIEASGLGVAYHAKLAVADAAHVSIAHGDLTALLYLQGYRRDEFVA